MNDGDKAKIRNFLADVRMSTAVKEVILAAFLKERKGSDVYQLAAQRLAIDLIQEAWRDLLKYQNEESTNAQTKQVGL